MFHINKGVLTLPLYELLIISSHQK